MKILMLGDVVGPACVELLSRELRAVQKETGADMIIVNCENASEGNGITRTDALALLDAGADVLTSGNHIWKKRDIRALLEADERILRPANYPAGTPGAGYTIVRIGGERVLVISLLGTMLMDTMDSPFEVADRILAREDGAFDLAVVDMHAETTSEKLALARYLDGRVSVLAGTHTHVQTADAQVLPGGTGYVTDLGMCGPMDGILGVRSDCILAKFKTRLPQKFELATGEITLHGALFDCDGLRCRTATLYKK